jgi:hypothetical protein
VGLTTRAHEPERSTGRLVDVGMVTCVAAIVALFAQVPLIRNHIFYYWDDSASWFLPSWYQMGLQLRTGHWPVLDPSMWMGGNFAAEAMLGVFNPVSLANFVVVSLLPDLALAATLVKTEFLVLLAVGIYLLAREYGASRAATAVVATALPFTGYTLYFDAQAWAGGLMAFAWLPLVWWSVRCYARGAINPVVPIIIGYLAISNGNPYGALGVMVILLALGVEQLVQRHWTQFGGVVVVGALIGISTLVVFLPLFASLPVTWRISSGVSNDGFMVPNLGDLLGLSAPTYLPQFVTFGQAPTSPVFYVAWFILPLLPWLSLSPLRQRTLERCGLAVFGVVFLLALVGPSALWLFRWPARLTEYATLPIGIAFAIVLTGGFRTVWPLRRSLASVALVAFGTYLSWASKPMYWKWHLLAALLMLVLLGATLVAVFRQTKAIPAVLIIGTGLTLALQAVLFPGNSNSTPWYFPHRVAEMKANYGQRYEGNTLQIGDIGTLASAGVPMSPQGAWRDLALGNTIHVAGVPALISYTGIGYVPFSQALCMNYYGGTCADLYRRLWLPAQGTNTQLVNALRLQTLVVLNGYGDRGYQHGASTMDPNAPVPWPPAGWSVEQRTRLVTVLRRDTPLPWPNGRLSWHSDGLTVRSDQAVGYIGERTEYTGSGTVLFAALAWPGWQATVDDRQMPITQGPAGLIEVHLPPAAPNGSTLELSFTPPGVQLGGPLIGTSLLIGISYGLLWQLLRYRRNGVARSAG